jgi:hypothetical protein
MRYINDREVELNVNERHASAYFERMLDQGHGIVSAVDAVSDRFGATLDLAFYGWLLSPNPTERPCTAHFLRDPYEAEPYSRNGVSYLMLRCTTCHRPQGGRLVRKARS